MLTNNITRKVLLAELAAIGWDGPVSYVSSFSSQGKATLAELLEAVLVSGNNGGWEYLASKGSGTRGKAAEWQEVVGAWELMKTMAG